MNLAPGNAFPDLDLPDHTGRDRRLPEIAGGDPVALLVSVPAHDELRCSPAKASAVNAA